MKVTIYRAVYLKDESKNYCGHTIRTLGQRKTSHWDDVKGFLDKKEWAKDRDTTFVQFLSTTERKDWRWEILEEKEVETRKEALILEDSWINKLQPSLNSMTNMKERKYPNRKSCGPHTDEWKENSSLSQPTREEVYCVETGEEFRSISLLLKSINCKISRSEISKRFNKETGFVYKNRTYKKKGLLKC